MRAMKYAPNPVLTLPLALAIALLAACTSDHNGGGNEEVPIDDGGVTTTPPPADIGTGKKCFIDPATDDGDDPTTEMIAAMVGAVPGDTIEFDCGYFDLTTTLQLANTEAITVKGCGKDETVLSFRNSDQQ